jgi:RNA polymerase sigma factor (sigma-70 family)
VGATLRVGARTSAFSPTPVDPSDGVFTLQIESRDRAGHDFGNILRGHRWMTFAGAVSVGLKCPDVSSAFPTPGQPMPESSTYDELIRQVRAWDQDAAAELIRRYEPAIRRVVRVRLADARLGNLLDSMDICQSVLKSFFVRAAAGQYELDTPEQLLKLLSTMARNKLTTQARGEHAQRRDRRRVVHDSPDDGGLVAPGRGPTAEVDARDLLHEVRRRLSADEQAILDLRNQGEDWAAIAARLGGGAEALRKRLARAIDRVAEELGLDGAP